MPTPTETLQAIRAEATVNAAALASVRTQLAGRVTAIEAWLPTTMKGIARDAAVRALANYDAAIVAVQRLRTTAHQALGSLGTGGDPVPPAITWSTGDW